MLACNNKIAIKIVRQILGIVIVEITETQDAIEITGTEIVENGTREDVKIDGIRQRVLKTLNETRFAPRGSMKVKYWQRKRRPSSICWIQVLLYHQEQK